MPNKFPPLFGWRIPTPPFESFTINRQSNQAQGLVFWIPTIGNRGTARLVELTKGLSGTFNGTPTWTNDSILGSGIDLDGSDFIDFVQTDDSYYTGDITLIWMGYIHTGSNYRHFMGKHASNGVSQNPFDFRTDNAAIPKLNLIRANTGRIEWQGPAVTLNTYQQYCVTSTDMNTVPIFYINGIATNGTVTFAGSGVPTGSGANIRIGRRADGAVQMDGVMGEVRIYNRILSPAEIWQIYDPATRWDLYRPLPRVFVVKVPSVAVTQTATHILDTILKKTQTATHLLDTVLKKTQTATHSLDTTLLQTRTTTHLIDTVLKKTQSATHALDVTLLKTQTASHTLDSTLLKTQTTTHILDSVLKQTKTATHSFDATLLKTQSLTHITDAYTVFRRTATHNLDSTLLKTQTLSHVLSVTLASGPALSLVATIQLLGQLDKTVSLRGELDKDINLRGSFS